MKRLIGVLMTVVLWFGCKSGIPSDIIKPDKMEKILYDIHIVDGYISTIYVPDSTKKVAAAYYRGIYKKFGTDSAEYNKSLKWYNNNPKELGEIYKNIEKALKQQKKSVDIADKMIQKKKFKADSLVIAKKFKADSLAIRKKMKPDSLSKSKATAQIAKKKKQADSLINIKKTGALEAVSPTTAPVQVQ